MRLAAKLGYEIKLIKGFIFNKSNLCSSYVNELYPLRIKTTAPAIKFIVKLMLNSLYGRFGMMRTSENFELVTQKEFHGIEKYHPIRDVQPLTYFENTNVPKTEQLISLVYSKDFLEGVEKREGVDLNILAEKKVTSRH